MDNHPTPSVLTNPRVPVGGIRGQAESSSQKTISKKWQKSDGAPVKGTPTLGQSEREDTLY
jgi:hypothetical protein